ncbi:MAG: hypothetical protein KF729_24070 [Sandaracinaceae bacterium]|nr:hypothetical protein [Sandaracinaceae bacterium]
MRILPLSILVALLCASCVPTTGRGGRGTASGGGAFTAQCRGDFGASAAANQFEAFMAATYDFHQAAEQTHESLRATCVAMAAELGVTPSGGAGPEGVRATCEQVATTLREEMRLIREGTDVTVEVRAQPPRCQASFDAYASCAASCDVNVTPGQVELSCTGGEIRGGCSGSCSGRCAVDVQAACSGVCEGSCDGTCSARASDGSCAGRCDGTCRGQCVADVNASCTGECRGSCSVEWQRPYCTGHYEPPQVDADCRAACEARVNATMTCEPGHAEMVVTGGPDAEAQARIERVRGAVRVGLAQLAVIRARTERLVDSGRALGQHLQNLPDAVRAVGIHAAACSAGALADIQQSLATTTVTLEVSVSVSASVSASAG